VGFLRVQAVTVLTVPQIKPDSRGTKAGHDEKGQQFLVVGSVRVHNGCSL